MESSDYAAAHGSGHAGEEVNVPASNANANANVQANANSQPSQMVEPAGSSRRRPTSEDLYPTSANAKDRHLDDDDWEDDDDDDEDDDDDDEDEDEDDDDEDDQGPAIVKMPQANIGRGMASAMYGGYSSSRFVRGPRYGTLFPFSEIRYFD
jgi:hypothetical protein